MSLSEARKWDLREEKKGLIIIKKKKKVIKGLNLPSNDDSF